MPTSASAHRKALRRRTLVASSQQIRRAPSPSPSPDAPVAFLLHRITAPGLCSCSVICSTIGDDVVAVSGCFLDAVDQGFFEAEVLGGGGALGHLIADAGRAFAGRAEHQGALGFRDDTAVEAAVEDRQLGARQMGGATSVGSSRYRRV
jgi:hypothetical protein